MVVHDDGAHPTPRTGHTTESEETVTELVAAMRGGDEAAWGRLHTRFTPLLRSIVSRHGLRDDDAAEVMQITWTTCYEHIARLREPAALPGWLGAICRHESIRLLKAQTRCTPMDFLGEDRLLSLTTADDPTAGEGLSPLIQTQDRELLRILLDQVGDRDRNLMCALAADNTSYLEVSTSLSIPVGSIGPTRQRVIAKVRRKADSLRAAA